MIDKVLLSVSTVISCVLVAFSASPFAATLLASIVNLWSPSAKGEVGVYDQLPSLSAVVVPSSGAFSPSPSNMLIVAFEVALPTKVGVLSFVICRPVLCEFSCSKILPSMSRLLLTA